MLCVENELLVLATLLYSTEEAFSPTFVIKILLTSPKKQDHCFSPIKNCLAFPEIFLLLHSISLCCFSQSDLNRSNNFMMFHYFYFFCFCFCCWILIVGRKDCWVLYFCMTSLFNSHICNYVCLNDCTEI